VEIAKREENRFTLLFFSRIAHLPFPPENLFHFDRQKIKIYERAQDDNIQQMDRI
jgi:hypothetical protein